MNYSVQIHAISDIKFKPEQGSMLTGKINEQQTTLSASTRHRLDLTVGEQQLFFVVVAVPGCVFLCVCFWRGEGFLLLFSLCETNTSQEKQEEEEEEKQ